jgi:hypothetical protein
MIRLEDSDRRQQNAVMPHPGPEALRRVLHNSVCACLAVQRSINVASGGPRLRAVLQFI